MQAVACEPVCGMATEMRARALPGVARPLSLFGPTRDRRRVFLGGRLGGRARRRGVEAREPAEREAVVPSEATRRKAH